MGNPETKATIGTRHRTKTNMGNPETKATIGTRHRTKTNKTKRHSTKN